MLNKINKCKLMLYILYMNSLRIMEYEINIKQRRVLDETEAWERVERKYVVKNGNIKN